ncbi:MAG: InlB B-repeat-containing protein, partial [Lachnospiraceae bacterium]|nr:InlB B-repeat-containing protein [Lachnospiraceae bacterium]
YTPTRDGYTFTGWYAEHSLKNKLSSVTLDASKTVYAGWEEIAYTWEIPAEITVKQGGSLSVPEKTFTLEAVVDGEIIGGAGCSYDITLDSDSIAATGAGTYGATLTFSGDYTAAMAISEGFSLSLADDSEAGWNCDDTEYTVTVDFDWETGEMTGFELTAAGRGSLTAAAFICTYTGWTLDFKTNGGSAIDSVSAVDGTEMNLSAYTPSRAGFTFTGWYSDSTLETVVTSVTLDADKTVYAGWEEIIYTWTVPVEITAKQSGSVSVPGKDFNLEVIVDGEVIDGVGTDYGITMDPGSVTVTGEGTFEEMVAFTGDYEAALLVTDGFTIGLADDGDAGWSCDDTVYNVTVNFDWETGEMTDISIDKSVQNQVLLLQSSSLTNIDPAVFTCTYTGYTLDFETNGGSEVDSVAAVAGTTIDLSACITTRSGHTFTGWYTDSELTTAEDCVAVEENMSVYAGWEEPGAKAVLLYTLTFETNGGSAIDSVTVEEGTVIDLSDYVPTRTGYTFTGWYTDSALTNRAESVVLDENMTVYAGWEKQSESDTDQDSSGDTASSSSDGSDQTTDSGSTKTTGSESTQTTGTNSVQTDDGSAMGLWMMILFLLGGLCAVEVIFSEKKRFK